MGDLGHFQEAHHLRFRHRKGDAAPLVEDFQCRFAGAAVGKISCREG
jgi:hypothetical protein